MKPLTKELIQSHLGTDNKIKRTLLGWQIDLASGASVKIGKKGRINFGKYRDPSNRKDIHEELFQCEFRDCLALANEIFGGVGLYGKCDKKDYTAVLEYAASEGINTGDQGLLLRHFGPDARIKYGWHSYTVSLPNGSYMKFDCGAITKVSGDVMRQALEMIHEVAPDDVVVRGKPDLLITAVHCGTTMGITVIPEGELKMFFAVTANLAVVLCEVLAFQWLDFWYALLIGYVGGNLLCMLGGRVFWKQLRDAARRRGLEIVKSEQFAKSRQASKDEARKQGML